jgi:DNA-binding MarR family transcriptional regulator
MPQLALERFLPYRLNVLAATVSESLARLYADRYGIGIPEWRLLATLGEFERMTGRDVAAHAHMHKTTVSRAATALAKRGWLKRVANRADQREALLVLTAKGRAAYEDLAPRALAFAAKLTAGLDADDRAKLDRLIAHLAAAAATGAGQGD